MLVSGHAQLSLAAAGITMTASGRTREGAEYAAFRKPAPGGKGTYACRVVRFKDGRVISERPYKEWGKWDCLLQGRRRLPCRGPGRHRRAHYHVHPLRSQPVTAHT